MNSGTLATRRAARPVAMRFSARASTPVSKASRRAPITAADNHSRRPGRSAATWPRRTHHAYSSAPATRNRTESMSSGGMVRSATAIARYVDPQTTYTVASAAASFTYSSVPTSIY